MTSLAPGARLGPYEILAVIGAGGMGEVYRASDTRLGRDVALKVIAFDVSSDPDRLRRFEQEARAVAALNHPNILSVYDVGTEAGAPYLVFELLEGEDLRQRLGREALPARKAVDWAAQIARGLAAAHDRGIIHRDLKPENLFVTKDGRVKILDFGLAKLLLGEETVKEAGDSATLSAGTNPGTLLGTVGYLSPEQVRGQAVDARSDIFALGAVLYEMLSGRRAFRRDTAADTLTAILKEDPPELVPTSGRASPALEPIIRRCLEKNPAERFRSAHDLAFDLERLSTLPGPTSPGILPGTGRAVRTFAAALVLGAVGLAAFLAGRRAGPVGGEQARQTPRGELRFQITLPTAAGRVSRLRLSPDGTKLAFVGTGSDGKRQLWVHSLSSLEARPLAGTDGVWGVHFWSPDSRSIGFFTRDKLKRIDVSGGPAQLLCALPVRTRFWPVGTWNRAGVVLFSLRDGHPLYRTSASGGTAEILIRPDRERDEDYYLGEFLPDGRHFIYFVFSQDPKDRGVYVGSLDSAPAKRLPVEWDEVTFAPPGHLLMRRGRSLLAQPFDVARLATAGEPVVVAETVSGASFSASDTGALALDVTGFEPGQPAWFDRGGKPLGTLGEPGPYRQMALSPDARKVAIERINPQPQTWDIWLIDAVRRVQFGVTVDPGNEVNPVWSPDGRRLAFSAEGAARGVMSIYQKELGGGPPELVLRHGTGRAFVEDWSRDGRFILYGAGVGGRGGLWAVPLSGDRKPFALVAPSTFNNDEPQLSPDGRFLTFVSAESGAYEVYVQGFPDPGTRVRISTEGGGQPRWRGDGRELFYFAPDGTVMAVDIKPGAIPEPGASRRLFSTPLTPRPDWDQYAVTADGQRFLVLLPAGAATSSPITVVLNWTAGLEK